MVASLGQWWRVKKGTRNDKYENITQYWGLAQASAVCAMNENDN